ncbi:MAG: hypothetical protein FWE83_08535 [Oscillospiraceae bacterium]|nr:hypothetical protein [Oscillospiraceae bacterium]
MYRCGKKLGITVIEMIVVLAVIAVLAAVAIPSLFAFVEAGRQTNRMNVARTLYLSAQNQLTELRIMGNLEAAMNAEHTRDPAFDTDATNVYTQIGDVMPPGEDVENRNNVFFLTKPAGEDPVGLMARLLGPVVDKAALFDGAIVLEFNRVTGVVLSAFYGDRNFNPAFWGAPGTAWEFTYDGADLDSLMPVGDNIRGMDTDTGYAPIARARRQGYYGVDNTSRLPADMSTMSITLYDSYDDIVASHIDNFGVLNPFYIEDDRFPGGIVSSNLLFARIGILAGSEDDVFTVSIPELSGLTGYEVYTLDIILDELEDFYEDNMTPFIESETAAGVTVILILDFVRGDTTTDDFKNLHSIGAGFNPQELITIQVDNTSKGSFARSFGKHPYCGAGSIGSDYNISSTRHLYNIRHVIDNAHNDGSVDDSDDPVDFSVTDGVFTQIASINVYGSLFDIGVTNFDPIRREIRMEEASSDPTGFIGTYIGNTPGQGHMISNLVVVKNSPAGLFSQIETGSIVRDLTLENPRVSGVSDGSTVGAVTGLNLGTIDGAYVMYRGNGGSDLGAGAFTDNARISFDGPVGTARAVGGIAGELDGGVIRNSVFISELADVHVNGDAAATTGGIVGRGSGTLENVFFLALAPRFDVTSLLGTVPTINPIVGTGSITSVTVGPGSGTAYFLSGKPFRPIDIDINTFDDTRVEYNEEQTNVIGVGNTTFELYELILNNWAKNRYEDPPGTWNELTEERIREEDSEYPYHYLPGQSQIVNAANHSWPIVTDELIEYEVSIYYYEQYRNGTYGFWSSLPGSLTLRSDNLLRHDQPIVEAGYIAMVVGVPGEPAPDGVKLFAGLWGVDDLALPGTYTFEPAPGDFVNVQTGFGLTSSLNEGIWGYRLPFYNNDPTGNPGFRGLIDLLDVNNLYTPLIFAYEVDGSIIPDPTDSDGEIPGVVHPLFAKAIYPNANQPPRMGNSEYPFIIRTPWQMQNVSDLNYNIPNPDPAAPPSTFLTDILFVQERDIDFAEDIGYSSPPPPANPNPRPGDGTFANLTGRNAVVQGNVQGYFNHAYLGRRINTGVPVSVSNVNITFTSATTLGIGLFARVGADGSVSSIMLTDSVITGSTNVGGIAGINNGEIDLCKVTVSTRTTTVGTEIVTTLDDRVTSIAGTSNVGGIAGTNSGTITRSGVEYSTVSGTTGNSTGGIAGLNAAGGTVRDVYFLSTSDMYDRTGDPPPVGDPPFATPPVSNNGGGIVGENNGTVSYAFYIAPSPRETVGATVNLYPIVRIGIRAWQYEDPLTERIHETCFYLEGHRYSLNEGRNWIGHRYNLVSNTPHVVCVNGGVGLVTGFMELEWLRFAYRFPMPPANPLTSVWLQPSRGYPYPMIRGLPIPLLWTEADSPARPDQVDRDDWVNMDSTSNRAINLGFINGDFSEGTFTTGNVNEIVDFPTGQQRRIYVDMNFVPGWYTRPVLAASFTPSNTGNQGNPTQSWRLIELQEPTNVAGMTNLHDYAYSNFRGDFNNPRTVLTSRIRYAELNANEQGTLYQICATTQGAEFYYSFYHTSRVSSGTTASDRMHFYLTGIPDGVKAEVENAAELLARDGVNGANLTLIRPCVTPRANRTTVVPTTGVGSVYNLANGGRTALAWNPNAWNTVAYGPSTAAGMAGYDIRPYHLGKTYLQPTGIMRTQDNIPTEVIYLYDVWVGPAVTGTAPNNLRPEGANGSNPTTGPVATAGGFGITFWSPTLLTIGTGGGGTTGGATVIPLNGITWEQFTGTGTATWTWLRGVNAPAQNNVIGYWGVEFGWKHYYGLYEVDHPHSRTEFAFQSRTSSPTNGNFLDGVSFKSPAFLSIEKFIRDSSGNNAHSVKMGDILTVELFIRNWGEVPADQIRVLDQLVPFDQYIEFISDSATMQLRSSTNSTAAWDTIPNMPSNGVYIDPALPANAANPHRGMVVITPSAPNANQRLQTNDELRVTFRIRVRNRVLANNVTETLLYYFKNQAVIEYNEDLATNSNRLDQYRFRVKRNGSGPEPVQVFIIPIEVEKTVRTDGITPPAVDPLIRGPFEVTLTVSNQDPDNPIDTTGMINDVIPPGFTIDEGSLVYRLNGVTATVPPGAVRYAYNADGSTTLTIWGADLGVPSVNGIVSRIEYSYTLSYTGSGYGVAYTHLSSNYRFLYTDTSDVNNPIVLSILMTFPSQVVGIDIITRPIDFSVPRPGMSVLDITANDNFTQRYTDDNYSVIPTVRLIGDVGSGNAAFVNADGRYQINAPDYTAILIPGTNMVEFTPNSTASGQYSFQYWIELNALRLGGSPETFALSSPVTTVSVFILENEAVAVYYEQYGVNDFGFFSVGGQLNTLDDSKPIIDYGYAVLSLDFTGKSARVGTTPVGSTPSAIPIQVGTMYLFRFTNTVVGDFYLQNVFFGDTGFEQSIGQIHPNFAKAVYSTAATSPLTNASFAIRTPQQMINISNVNAAVGTGIGGTSGMTFTQERNLDFAAFAGPSLNNAGAIVAGDFEGTFNVAPATSPTSPPPPLTISSVTISASPGVDDVGLFNINNGTISGINLRPGPTPPGTSITGDTRVGGIAGTNNGTISSCTVQGVDDGTGNFVGMHITGSTGPPIGVGGVAGIAGYNNGTITNCTVSNTTGTITGPDNVGGIVGFNAAAGTITNASVTNVRLVSTGTNIGIVVGNNTAPAGNVTYGTVGNVIDVSGDQITKISGNDPDPSSGPSLAPPPFIPDPEPEPDPDDTQCNCDDCDCIDCDCVECDCEVCDCDVCDCDVCDCVECDGIDCDDCDVCDCVDCDCDVCTGIIDITGTAGAVGFGFVCDNDDCTDCDINNCADCLCDCVCKDDNTVNMAIPIIGAVVAGPAIAGTITKLNNRMTRGLHKKTKGRK